MYVYVTDLVQRVFFFVTSRFLYVTKSNPFDTLENRIENFNSNYTYARACVCVCVSVSVRAYYVRPTFVTHGARAQNTHAEPYVRNEIDRNRCENEFRFVFVV